jgi:hypothetical protein
MDQWNEVVQGIRFRVWSHWSGNGLESSGLPIRGYFLQLPMSKSINNLTVLFYISIVVIAGGAGQER